MLDDVILQSAGLTGQLGGTAQLERKMRPRALSDIAPLSINLATPATLRTHAPTPTPAPGSSAQVVAAFDAKPALAADVAAQREGCKGHPKNRCIEDRVDGKAGPCGMQWQESDLPKDGLCS